MRRLIVFATTTVVVLALLPSATSAQSAAKVTISALNCDTSAVPATVDLTGTITPVPAVDFGIVVVSSVRGQVFSTSLSAGFDITGATVRLLLPLGTVTTTVFADPNRNAVQDPGEATIGTARLVDPCRPQQKTQCKRGGWRDFAFLGFKNQGDCVSYVATGGRNQPR
jgi:hypothetical protein